MNTRPVSKAFQMMRKFGLLAEQNYMCCMSCGCAGMQERYDDADDDAKPLGYAFYHEQDAEDLNESGECCVAYNAFGVGDSAAVGRIVAHCLESAGLEVDWSGSASQRIQFAIPRSGGDR